MRDLETELVTDRGGMARIFGCSVNHINKLVTRGLPRKARGQYDIPACVQWMISDTTSKSGIDPEELPAVVEARTRLYVAQEAHKVLETRRLAGELVEAEEVRANMLELAQLLVSALEGLPVRAAAAAAATRTTAEAAATLREECSAARDELATRIAALAEPVPAGEPPGDTATDQKRGRVGGRRARGTAGEPAPGTVEH